jgi:hypothetical protein
MATPYKILFDGVITKLKSTGIPNITEDELDEMLYDYIRPAIVKFRACRQNLNNKDDSLNLFFVDLTDEESEILINLMYIEYLSTNYINVPSLLRQSLVSTDYHAFSSANHLEGLIGLRDVIKNETKQMISIYSNIESEVFGKLKQISEAAKAEAEADDSQSQDGQ